MFSPSREDARRFFFDVWRKRHDQQPLTPLEHWALEIIATHPEYHAVLDRPARFLAREYRPEDGEINPFLHLSLHLAVTEQLSIDQPPGIRDGYQRLLKQHGDPMAAQHAIIDCLTETVWRAQRAGAPPDGARYLECLRGRSAR
ncbi:MAG TPA: DUF1841 domain-containing protein [Betaproteobacteria bacterium]|nr:DUF1841 domain-containing protein [Betaproteobacteria bacterium]